MLSRPCSRRPRSHMISASRAETRAAGWRGARRLEELDRLLEVRSRPRPRRAPVRAIVPARSSSSAWTSGSSVSSAARSKARCASALAAERGCAFGGPHEHLAGRRADLRLRPGRPARRRRRRGSARRRPRRSRPPRRSRRTTRNSRGREVLGLALPLRERLVGDVLDDVLQERVLAALGRARVGLDREDLLAERAPPSSGSSSASARPRERRQAVLRERLAEHGAVLDEPALLGREASSRAAISACSVSGHLERLDRRRSAGRRCPPVRAGRGRGACAPSRPRTAARPRPARGCARRSSSGEAGDEPGEQLAHRLRRQRLEVERA